MTTFICAADVSKEELEDLRVQIDLALRDPQHMIITNYPIEVMKSDLTEKTTNGISIKLVHQDPVTDVFEIEVPFEMRGILWDVYCPVRQKTRRCITPVLENDADLCEEEWLREAPTDYLEKGFDMVNGPRDILKSMNPPRYMIARIKTPSGSYHSRQAWHYSVDIDNLVLQVPAKFL